MITKEVAWWYIQQRNRKRREAGTTPVVYTDNFNRANGALGANWTTPVGSFNGADGALQIASNQVGAVTDDKHSFAFWNAAFTDNQYSQIKIVTTAGAWTGVVLRVEPTVDRYYLGFLFAANDYRIYRRWDTNFEQLAQGTSVTWVVGDVLKTEILGSVHPITINLYRNGAQVLTWTSPNAGYVKTGGKAGIGMYSPALLNLRLDDWAGGNL